MGSLKDIRKRIDSVKNTKQITRAMKMVAAAKLNRAEDAVKAARPYAHQMSSVIANIYERIDPDDHELLTPKDEVNRALIYVISSDRGLCGAYNLKLFRKIKEYIEENEIDAETIDVAVIGRQARERYQRTDEAEIEKSFDGIIGNVDYEQANRLGEDAQERFLEGKYDALFVAFNEFESALVYNTLIKRILPISIEELREDFTDTDKESEPSQTADYLYEPSKDELLAHILPTYINVRFLHALLEANAAEQGARMTAMDNATTNAEELIDDLTLEYNRARQAEITKEICEIVSGAEALE